MYDRELCKSALRQMKMFYQVTEGGYYLPVCLQRAKRAEKKKYIPHNYLFDSGFLEQLKPTLVWNPRVSAIYLLWHVFSHTCLAQVNNQDSLPLFSHVFYHLLTPKLVVGIIKSWCQEVREQMAHICIDIWITAGGKMTAIYRHIIQFLNKTKLG